MDEFEFLLEDRIAKIKAINEQLDLLHNSYLSFSGGKDSTVLHYLLDMALPNNNIPRIHANTGLEYQLLTKFVKDMALKDKRIIILNQTRNIPKTLREYGYPFKSKEHSLRVDQFNKGTNKKYIYIYMHKVKSNSLFKCPKSLLYQFEEKGKYNYSNLCCQKLKKDLMKDYAKKNNLKITITGMRRAEGGNRRNLSCLTSKNAHFHPLIVCDDKFIDEFIKRFNIKLCDLYYEPYNFKRTGCKGCPFNIEIEKELIKLKEYQPKEFEQCMYLWKYVYDEYDRINYRLSYNRIYAPKQLSIFDEEVNENDKSE